MLGIICHKMVLTRGFIMSDSNELVTIGITCFNAENTIERAVQSALAQDWRNIEVIVVDDMSTDGSVKIVESLAEQEARLRFIKHNSNGGPAASRNTIVNEAEGEYIAYFDDDDVSYKWRIREQLKQLKYFEQKYQCQYVVCIASGKRRYPNGYVKEMPAIGSIDAPFIESGIVANYLLTHNKVDGFFYGSGTPACAFFARKSTIEWVGGFDEKLRRVEDADFAIRHDLKGGVFTGTKRIAFEQFATDAPDKSPQKNLESELKMVIKNRSFLAQNGMEYYGLNWPRLRYYHFSKKYFKLAFCFLGIFLRYPIRSLSHIMETGLSRLRHERAVMQQPSND